MAGRFIGSSSSSSKPVKLITSSLATRKTDSLRNASFKRFLPATKNFALWKAAIWGTSSAMPVLLKQAAKQEPAFGAVGGDIAYANDQFTNFSRWDTWLDGWEQTW